MKFLSYVIALSFMQLVIALLLHDTQKLFETTYSYPVSNQTGLSHLECEHIQLQVMLIVQSIPIV